MLNITDRYIVRKFLFTFLFVVLLFSLITVVVDFSSKVNDFLEAPIPTRTLFWQYYPSFLLFIGGLSWPLFTLITVVYFTSRLSANNEILAIFNMGAGLHRIMRPYLFCALLLGAILLGANHYLIPIGNQQWLGIQYQHLTTGQDEGKTRHVHLFVAPDTKIYLERYVRTDSVGQHFRLEQYRGQKLIKYIKARTIKWLGPPARWRLRYYEIHHLRGLRKDVTTSPGSLDTTFNLVPEDFVDYKDQHFMLTTPELKRYIQRQRERGINNTAKYEAEHYRRTADAFTIVILTLLGLSIGGRKSRGGTGWHMALGIGLGASFLFLSRFSTVFATGQVLPLMLGVWLPNIFFGLITLYLLFKAQQ